MIQTNLREIDMEDICAEEYAEQLSEFGATVVTLNACGIIASYETEHPYHTKSEYLHGDNLKKLIDECHKRGIRVIARADFTKVKVDLHKKHPEWACRTASGDIINYNGNVHVCPNSDYQQKILFEILKETLTTHPFDGVFCNMSGFVATDYSGNYYGICHCENCKKKFREFCGDELPEKEDPDSPVYIRYEAFKEKCTSEHRARMNALIKGINEDIALNGVDYIRSESGTEIGRQTWIYSASGNARLAKGSQPLRPADNASVDYMGFRYRHISVSPELAALRQWQCLANAGSVSFYIIGLLENHRDRSTFEPTKRVFQFHKEHEDLFRNMTGRADVLLISNGNWKRNDAECYGWIRALTESHIPFDEIIMDEFNQMEQLDGKHFLLLPEAKRLTLTQAKMIDEFVQQGGTLIQTGFPAVREGRALLASMGMKAIKEFREKCCSSMFEISSEKDKKTFTRCKLTPFVAPGEKIVLAEWSEDADKYLTLIPEHPFGPPELCYFSQREEEPGVVVNRFGKGKCITVPFRIGTFYYKEGHSNSLRFMQDILFQIAQIHEIAPGLSPMVELTRKQTGENEMIQLVNNSGIFSNSFFAPLPVVNIKICLPGMTGRQVRTLNGGTVTVTNDGDTLAVTLNVLNEYEAILLEG